MERATRVVGMRVLCFIKSSLKLIALRKREEREANRLD